MQDIIHAIATHLRSLGIPVNITQWNNHDAMLYGTLSNKREYRIRIHDPPKVIVTTVWKGKHTINTIDISHPDSIEELIKLITTPKT